jgi:hypothetical protein
MDYAKELGDIINGLEVSFLKKRIQYLDAATFANACKTLDQGAVDKIMQSITPKEADDLKNRIAALGTPDPEEVANSQERIISMFNTIANS